MRHALFGLLLILSAPAIAEIYTYTDAQGNTVYTNQPPDGIKAERVELPPPNTVEIQVPSTPAPLPTDAEAGQAYRSLALAGIPDEAALRANNGTFVVSAVLEPPLQRGHQLRFVLDGMPQATASQATSLQLNNVARGEHRLQVEVLSNGRVIQRSEPQSFTVQRVHTSSPALRHRAAP
ncbi:hypothetical protein YO5_17205 [Stutzerimonas stutzeri TS44]|nr:hypothetical protein YO5_17205 [Stutzerimonas stutzeri TS44]